MQNKMYYNLSTLTQMDIYLFKQGSYTKMYEKFGAHSMTHKGKKVFILQFGLLMQSLFVFVGISTTMKSMHILYN